MGRQKVVVSGGIGLEKIEGGGGGNIRGGGGVEYTEGEAEVISGN